MQYFTLVYQWVLEVTTAFVILLIETCWSEFRQFQIILTGVNKRVNPATREPGSLAFERAQKSFDVTSRTECTVYVNFRTNSSTYFRNQSIVAISIRFYSDYYFVCTTVIGYRIHKE